MKLKFLSISALLASAAMLSSCGNTEDIGSDLIQIDNKIYIEDDFTVSGESVDNDKVQSRTIMQLLGSIDAKEYGRFRSDFVTQFMPVAEIDSKLKSSEDIDSVKLLMMFTKGSYVGDSVIPMGLEIYRLERELKAPIYSDFNPEEYYDASKPIGSRVYGASNLELPTDSLKKLGYREIFVDMPLSMGRELFDLYKTNPESYLSPTEFSKHFRGLYVKNSYGSGRVTKIQATVLQLYYHYSTINAAGNDTVIHTVGNFYQASPEIISNNIIDYEISPMLTKRVADGEKLIVAPAGLDVELKFPLLDVIKKYKEKAGKLSVVNSLSMSIPAERIANEFGINPPDQLLLILKNKKQEFFEKSKITDGKTSFYATLSPVTGCYEFSSLRDYLLDALDRESDLTEEDFTFVLTPVVVQTESSGSYYSTTSYIKAIVPYVEQPAMVRLNLENAKIILTFSNQNLKN